ncbi:ABC-three component system middle component 1 [Azospirillum sp. sgz302134]
MTDLDILANALAVRAEMVQHDWPDALSLAVSRTPKNMLKRRLWVEHAAAGITMEGRPLVAEDDLPRHAAALSIGYHRVLIGSLGTDPDSHAVEGELRRHLNQAAIDWSWLGHTGDDLLLILVGPSGSDEDEAWREAMNTIERDERVCRKLVWLPPSDPKKLGDALDGLLNRTFLARPWPPTRRHDGTAEGQGGEHIAGSPAGDLDRVARLFTRIAGEGFSEDEAKRWIAILSDPKESPDLAERLVHALEVTP